MLDDDGDGALTIKEIKDGMSFHKMDRVLNDDEWKLFYQEIDANADGVLTEEEWCEFLEPKVSAQADY
jgi:Ca2+-binding EF-hand superfamily protein